MNKEIRNAMHNIGNPENFNLDWNKIEIVRHSNRSSLEIIGEIDPDGLAVLNVLRQQIVDTVIKALVEYKLSMSQLDRIKLWLADPVEKLPAIPRKATSLGQPINPVCIPSPNKKSLHIIFGVQWFDTSKTLLEETNDIKSRCTFEQLAALLEVGGDGEIAYASFDADEDFEAGAIGFRRRVGAEHGPADHEAYERFLKSLEAKGVTPGLRIGDNAHGSKLAMKYLCKGLGDHIPEAQDKAAYPEMVGVTVRLSWEPDEETMTSDWMIDVVFIADSGNKEQFGFRCQCTDHEITISMEDAKKLGEETENYDG
jgi:hypothetical protein